MKFKRSKFSKIPKMQWRQCNCRNCKIFVESWLTFKMQAVLCTRYWTFLSAMIKHSFLCRDKNMHNLKLLWYKIADHLSQTNWSWFEDFLSEPLLHQRKPFQNRFPSHCEISREIPLNAMESAPSILSGEGQKENLPIQINPGCT